MKPDEIDAEYDRLVALSERHHQEMRITEWATDEEFKDHLIRSTKAHYDFTEEAHAMMSLIHALMAEREQTSHVCINSEKDANKLYAGGGEALITASAGADERLPPAPDSREIPDTYELTQRIEESLAFFCDEFPKDSRPEIWSKPVSYHCGGITPDDLQTLLSILYARPKPVLGESPLRGDDWGGGTYRAQKAEQPVAVSLEKCAHAIGTKWFDGDRLAIAKAVLDAAGVKYVE